MVYIPMEIVEGLLVKIRVLKSEFIYSAPRVGLMRDLAPEIAFIGRSNTGKSSLINAISGKGDLARTSKTPGRTRHAVAYGLVLAADIEKPITLIDLPGFGFALMSKQEAKECETLIFSYLERRAQLCLIVLLLDIRRDLDEREQRIVRVAKERHIDVLLVLTKSDKIAVSKRSIAKRKVAEELLVGKESIILHSTHDEKTTMALKKAIYLSLPG